MYYDILDKLRTHLDNDPLTNTVSQADIFSVDLGKQNIFPIAHIIVNGATFEGDVINYNISILAMDILDISKKEATDKFIGNDNEQDIMNTQLSILNRMYEQLRRGNIYDDNFQVSGTPTLEPFSDRFENKLCGWVISFNLLTPNYMSIC